MKKALSYKEIKEIINKLNEQYIELGNEHGKSFFDKKAFENRYLQALRSSMNLQAFAFSEIAFLESLKDKLKMKKEERRIKKEKPFTKKIEQYIDELEKRWEKYPKLYGNSELSDEAQFFCGAISVFFNEFWLKIPDVIGKNNIHDIKNYNSLTEGLQLFVFALKNRMPYAVEQYEHHYRQFGIEKANMLFLKEGVQILTRLKQFLNALVYKRGNNDDEISSVPSNDILDKTVSSLEEIIFDFRFNNLIP